MADREKVIKGLETIKQFFGYGLPSTAEMFNSYYDTLNGAIALLKEQEAMIPARAVAEWLAEYAAPPEMKIVPGTHEGRTFAWLAVLETIRFLGGANRDDGQGDRGTPEAADHGGKADDVTGLCADGCDAGDPGKVGKE